APLLPELGHVDDVGVTDARDDARLVEEHVAELGLPGEVGKHPLQHHRALETPGPDQLAEEDLGHPAAREEPEDPVASDPFGKTQRMCSSMVPRSAGGPRDGRFSHIARVAAKITLALLFALCAMAAPARAQEGEADARARALELFRESAELYRQGRFEDAAMRL